MNINTFGAFVYQCNLFGMKSRLGKNCYKTSIKSDHQLISPKQVEKFLNDTPAVSVWVNGDKLDSLIEKNDELGEQFEHVERRYEDMDEMFKESMKVFETMDRMPSSPFDSIGIFPKHFSLFPDYSFPQFRPNVFDGHGMLSSFFDMTQKMFERFHKIIHDPELNKEPFPEEGKK